MICPLFTARIRSMGQGNVFTDVCHSVQKGGLHSHQEADPSPEGRRSTGGRYASYWNAYLLNMQLQLGLDSKGQFTQRGND